MRGAIVFGGVLILGIAASCIPVIDLDADDKAPPPGVLLAASVNRPADDRTVPTGAVVSIEWTAANLTNDEAIATLLVRKRSDRSETILTGGVLVTEVGVRESFDWNTANFDGGEYNVLVRIVAGELTDEEIGAGIITINSPPQLSFTEPFEDTTLENEDPESDETPTVRIRWSAFDPDGDGKLELGVDPDTDHTNGNEIILVEKDLETDAAFDSFDWDGNDGDDVRVDTGVYNVYARIFDEINTDVIVNGLATITVPDAPEEVENAVTQPEEDRTFLTTDATTRIEYTISQDDDVLIDLKIDTDDNHQNGNEITILSQRLVEADTTSGNFDWNGQNSAGAAVADGIYRVFMAISTGAGNPTTFQAEGLVFRRAEANKPLIGLLQPATNTTSSAGSFLNIRWRDDDPSETGRVFLFVDDDPNPEEATETGAAEIEILANRDAGGDDVQDSFSWQIPSTLAPGTYYIFAYVDRDGARPFEQSSVAPGRLIIPDPANP